MPNWLIYLIVIPGTFILLEFTEWMIGKRKKSFFEAFLGIGIATFWLIHTFLVPSLWDIIISAFLIFAGIKWFLNAKKAQDEKCCYCDGNILFWQKLIISINPPKICHKRCKK